MERLRKAAIRAGLAASVLGLVSLGGCVYSPYAYPYYGGGYYAYPGAYAAYPYYGGGYVGAGGVFIGGGGWGGGWRGGGWHGWNWDRGGWRGGWHR